MALVISVRTAVEIPWGDPVGQNSADKAVMLRDTPERWGFQGLTQEFVWFLQKEVSNLIQVTALRVFSVILLFHKYSRNTKVSVTAVLIHIKKPGKGFCCVFSHILLFNSFIFLKLASRWENPPASAAEQGVWQHKNHNLTLSHQIVTWLFCYLEYHIKAERKEEKEHLVSSSASLKARWNNCCVMQVNSNPSCVKKS